MAKPYYKRNKRNRLLSVLLLLVLTFFALGENPAQASAARAEPAARAVEAAAPSVWAASGGSAAAAASTEAAKDGSEQLSKLLPLIGGALASASQGNWTDAAERVGETEKLWRQLKAEQSVESADVDSAVAHAVKAAAAADDNPDAAKLALSELVKALNSYVKAEQGSTAAADEEGTSGKEAAEALLPDAERMLVAIQAGGFEQASAVYQRISAAWPAIEAAIRVDNFGAYGKLETAMSMIRIALQAEPPRAEQAERETHALISLLGDYRDGKLVLESEPGAKLTISDMLAILDKASKDIASGHYAEADGQMQTFITKWPLVEGQVSIRSADAYNRVELQMTEVSRYLLAKPPAPQQAEEAIGMIREVLQPLAQETSYTAWDAGAILLREGLEALLVIAALLAYLKRTGNADKTRWIWSGAGAGLLLSIGIAVLLTNVIAQAAAGSAREAMEGVTGLVSVILMLGVGSWLHSKSNLRSWSSYIDDKLGSALAKGSLWSLFLVSGLAVLREGAETTIFYAGMAPSIAPGQLALGISATLALLVLIGYAMIRFSAKLPIRPFFLLASALIYYLAIRFVGESLHSLQVAGWIPSHLSGSLPTIGPLGVYPTWETTLPQLLVLLVVLLRFVWVRFGLRATAGPS